MARKQSSSLPALLQLASKLPWWLSVIFAVVSGWLLHSLASAPVAVDARHMNSMLVDSAFKGMATFAQFFVPVIFIGGAIASMAGRRKRRQLLDSMTVPRGNTLLSITWREFELLVGEALRRQGFNVQENGGAGPDGGIDLVLHRDGEKYLVQCKQWRSVQVGVPVVRELYGAMAAEGAVGGFVITSGRFTDPAKAFADGRNLQLVDGVLLRQWIEDSKCIGRPPVPVAAAEPLTAPEIKVPAPVPAAAPPPAPETVAELKAPACPHCKKLMVIKVARTGRNAGGNFWGCTGYPQCRGIRAYLTPMSTK